MNGKGREKGKGGKMYCTERVIKKEKDGKMNCTGREERKRRRRGRAKMCAFSRVLPYTCIYLYTCITSTMNTPAQVLENMGVSIRK